MRFTFSWLKDHLDTDASLEQVCDRLTAIGLEVEKVDDRKSLLPFIVAKVLSVESHPISSNLKVLEIDIGKQKSVRVVCGAPNVRVGLLGVWAPPGSYMPGTAIKIDVKKIGGIESCGILCSEKELMLSDNHNGIMELPSDASIGEIFSDYAGLSDPVIEIGLTPNRPDCAGIRGIASDLAASGLGSLKEISLPSYSQSGSVSLDIRVNLDDMSLCQAFYMCRVRGVRNVSSPKWMCRRLEAVGLRSISALVDVTNYISLELGYPLHVFDVAKISGDIIVRRASEGEKIMALDDRVYDLSPENIVVASDHAVESIAGIIGGKNACCDDDTTDVLIEAALWNPINIAFSGQQLGILTESRYRFERGVDLQGTMPALKRAISLIVSLCGGIASEISIGTSLEYEPRKIDFPCSEVRRLTGIDIPAKESLRILQNLGFNIEASSGDLAIVSVPSWRRDVKEKADLVEEILRIYGVDKIEGQPFPITSEDSKGELSVQQRRIRFAKRVLAARAMMEVVTLSFIPKEQSIIFGGENPKLKILNPISLDMSDMRTSIFPGLLTAVSNNIDRAITEIALFEVSDVYDSDEPEGQRCMASGVRWGSSSIEGSGRFWSEKHGNSCRDVDVFDAKADALAVIESFISIDSIHVEPVAPSWYHPGRSGTIKMGKEMVLGCFGQFHPEVLDFFGLSEPLCGFEVYLDSIPISTKKSKPYTKKVMEMSSLQPIRRDFAFVVDKSSPAGALVKSIKKVDPRLIIDVTVFDIFESKSLGKDKKSIALEVVIQPFEKTYSEDDFKKLTELIIESVKKSSGAILRSS
ncbi:phenylalanine--tRNA ligase subunit beta [Candidatus Liberibacter sp.]|uniref:phenylalanine--tRNA ligase subunit beta n=1 Tax=Candidatus Liberibacter sp. TaxID=34022 RepID=UPI0015F7418E|nr:phenylalanine--tRNA ligase subunit beta [Candidatus Liberibacter sp.]MBA5723568.1 phenylalanine--tRNA ligase subunit beta [Candidatus Liberibacter sp.]